MKIVEKIYIFLFLLCECVYIHVCVHVFLYVCAYACMRGFIYTLWGVITCNCSSPTSSCLSLLQSTASVPRRHSYQIINYSDIQYTRHMQWMIKRPQLTLLLLLLSGMGFMTMIGIICGVGAAVISIIVILSLCYCKTCCRPSNATQINRIRSTFLNRGPAKASNTAPNPATAPQALSRVPSYKSVRFAEGNDDGWQNRTEPTNHWNRSWITVNIPLFSFLFTLLWRIFHCTSIVKSFHPFD